MVTATDPDSHYYAGSLVGAAFDILELSRSKELLRTAERELLDPKLGIRNAMPPDFHTLIDQYRFNGREMGGPYQYLNGGVWPHGTNWYIQGLLTTGQPEKAYESLKKYLTLPGIENSPNGQPSFYEYRNANPTSAEYGAIDKSTFLWAGGWYLNTLYQMLGLVRTPWNIRFDTNVPEQFGQYAYVTAIQGNSVRISMKGDGKYFREIKADRKRVFTAVDPVAQKSITLIRGLPEVPYLAEAECRTGDVYYERNTRTLSIGLEGALGQSVRYKVISPFALDQTDPEGIPIESSKISEGTRYIYSYEFRQILGDRADKITLKFSDPG